MYKNWKAICQIPDGHVMWALALLDMYSDIGRKFVERFPEYFTHEKQEGPIPLSVLRRKANEVAGKKGFPAESDALVSDEACAYFNIPVQVFNGPRGTDPQREPLPAEFAHLIEAEGIGHTAEWGCRMVVLVENGFPDYASFAPAELIALDC